MIEKLEGRDKISTFKISQKVNEIIDFLANKELKKIIEEKPREATTYKPIMK